MISNSPIQHISMHLLWYTKCGKYSKKNQESFGMISKALPKLDDYSSNCFSEVPSPISISNSIERTIPK